MESNFNSHIPKNSTNMNFNICFFHNNRIKKVKLDALVSGILLPSAPPTKSVSVKLNNNKDKTSKMKQRAQI